MTQIIHIGELAFDEPYLLVLGCRILSLHYHHDLQVAALHSGNECRIVSNDHFR